MTNEEVFGRVDFSVFSELVPWRDPSEFVHMVTGKIITYSETDEDIEAGKIYLRLVLATEATNAGQDLSKVCDADSAVLDSIDSALFDQNGETREELDIEVGWNNLVFLEAVVVVPEVRQTMLMVQAIETALAMFASEGLVVAIEEVLELTIEQWKRLGFRRIAGTGFVFRDQLKVNPYQDKGSAWPEIVMLTPFTNVHALANCCWANLFARPLSQEL